MPVYPPVQLSDSDLADIAAHIWQMPMPLRPRMGPARSDVPACAFGGRRPSLPPAPMPFGWRRVDRTPRASPSGASTNDCSQNAAIACKMSAL